MVSYSIESVVNKFIESVLILVVVDDGLVLRHYGHGRYKSKMS